MPIIPKEPAVPNAKMKDFMREMEVDGIIQAGEWNEAALYFKQEAATLPGGEEMNILRALWLGVDAENLYVRIDIRGGLKDVYGTDLAVALYLANPRRMEQNLSLIHIFGYDDDRLLASKVPGIDIIVGGHSHTKLDRPELVANTVIVQSGEHAESLGSLEVSYENGKITDYAGALIPCGPDVVEDSRIGEIIRTYNKELEVKLSEVIGEAAVALDGERANVRTRETNLGNLVADAVSYTHLDVYKRQL